MTIQPRDGDDAGLNVRPNTKSKKQKGRVALLCKDWLVLGRFIQLRKPMKVSIEIEIAFASLDRRVQERVLIQCRQEFGPNTCGQESRASVIVIVA
jgi:hypothetical protein